MENSDKTLQYSKSGTPAQSHQLQNQYQGYKDWKQFLEDYRDVISKIQDPKIREKLLGTPFIVNTVVFTDGLYEGEMKEGHRGGKGVLFSHSLSTFSFGEWRYSKLHGVGIEYCFKNGSCSEGEWVEDHQTGVGRFTMMGYCSILDEGLTPKIGGNATINGKTEHCSLKYEGNLKCDLPHGKGIMKYFCAHSDELEHDGEWENGIPNGYGTAIYTIGRKCVGEWKNGACTEKVQLYHNDIKYYEGDLLNGLRHGKGKSFSGYGVSYDGEFIEGRCDGFGTAYYEDGGKYVGSFKDGKANGIGTYCAKNGQVWGGNWIEGQFIPPKEGED